MWQKTLSERVKNFPRCPRLFTKKSGRPKRRSRVESKSHSKRKGEKRKGEKRRGEKRRGEKRREEKK